MIGGSFNSPTSAILHPRNATTVPASGASELLTFDIIPLLFRNMVTQSFTSFCHDELHAIALAHLAFNLSHA